MSYLYPRPDLNPIDYVIKENIPIFGEYFDAESAFLYEDTFLNKVVNASKEREKTGDYILVTLGHTVRDLPEIEQPPVVGFATNLRIERDDDFRTLVVADIYLDKDKYNPENMDYMRRSSEVWPEGYIDIVALLRRAPKLDLGLMTGAREWAHDSYVVFKKEEETHKYLRGEAMNHEELKKFIEETVKGCLEQHYAKFADEEKEEEKEEEKFSEEEDKKEEEDVEEKANNSKNESGAIRAALFERENIALRKQVEDLARKFSAMSHEKELIQLEAEGFQLDRSEELAYLSDLTEQQASKHFTRIRKSYIKVPNFFGKIPVAVEAAPVTDKNCDPNYIQQVLEFGRKNRITTFEAASKEFDAKKGK